MLNFNPNFEATVTLHVIKVSIFHLWTCVVAIVVHTITMRKVPCQKMYWSRDIVNHCTAVWNCMQDYTFLRSYQVATWQHREPHKTESWSDWKHSTPVVQGQMAISFTWKWDGNCSYIFDGSYYGLILACSIIRPSRRFVRVGGEGVSVLGRGSANRLLSGW